MTGPGDRGEPSSVWRARDRRVRRRADYLRIQGHGCRVTSKHFVFLLALRESPGPARLGITVSRKVGTAVVRNRAKRLVREAFQHLPDLVPDGVDLVVIVRSMWTGAKMADVVTEWQGVARVLARQARLVLRDPSAGEGSA